MGGYYVNPGGAWSKDYLVFDLDTVRPSKDARRVRVPRGGEVFQRGALAFPTGAQMVLEPSADTPEMPENLRTDPVLPLPPVEAVQPAEVQPSSPPVEAAQAAEVQEPVFVHRRPPPGQRGRTMARLRRLRRDSPSEGT